MDWKLLIKGQLFNALVWYLFSLYIMDIAVTLTSWLSRAHFGCIEDSSDVEFSDRILYDVGFEFIDEWPEDLNWFPNVWLSIGIGSFIVFTLLRKSGSSELKRWMFMHMRIMWLRSLVVCITIIPDPWGLCSCPPGSNDVDQKRFLRNPLLVFVEGRFWLHTIEKIWNGMFTCGDMMFSGHTIVYSLIMLYGITIGLKMHTRSESMYNRLISNIPASFFVMFSVLYGVIGMVSLLATHFHYTMDILISLYITVLIWRLEITTMRNKKDRRELRL